MTEKPSSSGRRRKKKGTLREFGPEASERKAAARNKQEEISSQRGRSTSGRKGKPTGR